MVGFSGGDKLQKELARLTAKLNKPVTLNVGFLENATYSDGTRVAMVAAIHEFGAPAAGIPPRPFMRPTVAKGEKVWGGELAKVLKATGYDGPASLALMGERIKTQIQEAIVAVTSPALKPATVARKGFDKPLVDTGHMLNSVDYEIKK